MKRSKILSYITSFMIDGGYNNYTKVEAEELLDMLEFQGMLPPPDGVDGVTSNIIYAYYDERVESDPEYADSCYSRPIISKLWEPEDE